MTPSPTSRGDRATAADPPPGLTGSDLGPPLVSVVMPVYNGGRFLGETLPHVDAQSHARVERIAVDDGSTDDSLRVLSGHAFWRVTRVSRLGSNGARRAGLELSGGTYVAFLDQDDVWHPGHLASCVRLLEARPDVPAAVGRRSRFRDPRRPLLRGRGGPLRWYDPWQSFPFQLIDSPSMVVIRRSALDRIGGWPEEGGPAADCLAWWRLGALGPFAVASGRTVGIREVVGSMSAVDRRQRRRCLDNMHLTAIQATECLDDGRRASMRNRADSLFGVLSRVIDDFETLGPIESAALEWERAQADQPDALVLVGVRFLGWLLHADRQASTSPEWRHLVDAVLHRWPASAPRTGRELRRWIAVSSAPGRIASALLSGPTRLAAGRCLLESLAAGLMERGGWTADPLDLDLDALPLGMERRA